MLRVIVNVRRVDQSQDYDLEVPAETPMADLSRFIVAALNLSDPSDVQQTHFSVRLSRSKRVISPDETLADVGAWDGSELVFQSLPGAERFNRNQSGSVLAIKLHSDSGSSYVISASPTILGRRTPSTATIKHLIDLRGEPSGKSVSRRHAKLEWLGSVWQLTPLHGLHNRTLVNGNELNPDAYHVLQEHDEITLGNLKLRVVEIVRTSHEDNSADSANQKK